MKSVVMKSIYAGLGLLGTGKETVEQLGRKLAKQASVSEKDGQKIARQLRARSEKAINTLQKTLESEVSKVVGALQSVTASAPTKKPAAKKKSKSAPRGKHKAAARR